MALFRRGQPPEALAAAMAGIKMGDRVLLAIAVDMRLAAELATRAGLSGRVVLLAPDAVTARTHGAAIEAAGAFVETEEGSLAAMAAAPGSFDVAIAESTLDALPPADRDRAIAECYRVLRPGGRLVWIENVPRTGLFGSGPAKRGDDQQREHALAAAGFRGVRTLAAAAGRVFVEGIKAAGQ